MGFTRKIFLTPEQVQWMRKHYKDTPNATIMEKLGISAWVLFRLRNELRLKKSASYIRELQQEKIDHCNEQNRRKGWPPKGHIIPNAYHFQKGITPVARFGKETWEEACRKGHESYMRTLASERRRVLFGMEQKTKFRIGRQPRAKYAYRASMRSKGYIETDEKNVLYYPNEAMRHPIAESHAERHNIKILPLTHYKSWQ